MPDLSVTSQSNLTILFGDGQGGFKPGAGKTPPAGYASAVADFNGDGRLDIAANGPGGLQILLGSLAQPTVHLTQLPPSPFDIGQTTSLMARVTPDPGAFQTAVTGQIALTDGMG